MFGLFKRITLINREAEIYRKEKFLEVDRLVEDYRHKRQKEVQALAQLATEQLGAYEHDFHNAYEKKGIELAKLDAKIEALQQVVKARDEVIKADNNLLSSKDSEIKRLNDIITLMINKQPSTTVQLQQLK